MAVYQTTLPSFLACSSDPSCARIGPGVRRIVIKSRNNRNFLPFAIVVSPSPVKTRLKVISLTDIFSDWIFFPQKAGPVLLLLISLYPGVYPEGRKFTRVSCPEEQRLKCCRCLVFTAAIRMLIVLGGKFDPAGLGSNKLILWLQAFEPSAHRRIAYSSCAGPRPADSQGLGTHEVSVAPDPWRRSAPASA